MCAYTKIVIWRMVRGRVWVAVLYGMKAKQTICNCLISEPLLFTEAIVMLVAGRTTGNAKNFRPWFFSLNPDLVPLPACLTGSKSNIDSFHRHRSPLILGQGMWGIIFHMMGLGQTFNFRWKTSHVWWS